MLFINVDLMGDYIGVPFQKIGVPFYMPNF